MSVRLNECRPKNDTEDNKKIAYLIDMQTIRVLDLVTGITVGTVNHDAKVDWLELNPTGRFTIFESQSSLKSFYFAVLRDTVHSHFGPWPCGICFLALMILFIHKRSHIFAALVFSFFCKRLEWHTLRER